MYGDEMTPKERSLAYSKGEPIDRLPIMPFLGAVSGKILGMTVRETKSSGMNMANAQIAAYKRFGSDGLSASIGLHAIGIALGSTTNNPENGIPAITDYVLKDLNKIDTLNASKLDVKKDFILSNCFEAAEILLEKLGDECNVGVSLPGPFTAAASIFQTELLLRAVRCHPEKVHELLKFSSEAIKNLSDQYGSLGVSFSLADPVASGTLLHPKQYREFCLPYTKDIVNHIHTKHKKSVGYHICGNTKNILLDMVATGVNTISLDNLVDLEFAKKTIGDKIPLLGNTDPVGILMFGTKEEIDNDVKTCFRKAFNSPKGYILASGCEIPPDTPLENIDHFMAAGRKYSKWPLDPERYL